MLKDLDRYLQAEFPHLWPSMEKLVGGKTTYTDEALARALGKDWRTILGDSVSMGLFESTSKDGRRVCVIPFLYRKGLELTQGQA